MRYLFPLLAIVAGTLFASSTEAQIFKRLRLLPQRNCVNQQCQNQYTYEIVEQTESVSKPIKTSVVPKTFSLNEPVNTQDQWQRTAARCVVGNSCGSASLCGHYKTGSLFLTNAHVTGTRPGTACQIRMVVDGKDKTFAGRIIMAAYSDRTLTDWSVVYVEEKIPVEPRPLSVEKPNGDHVTVGAPRCVWPLVKQDLRTADVSDNSALWRWRPNSIGGQSGSGVWSVDDGLQYGLLTWSWGGLGAGQQTAEIYRQAKEKSVRGLPRIDGLKEVGRNPDVVIENGFFQQAGIDELPIWHSKDAPEPTPDPDLNMDEEDRKLFKFLKKLRPKARERGIDIEKLMQLILLLIEIFAKK